MCKRCTKCGVEKPLDEFHVMRTSRDGHRPNCKVCQRAARAAFVDKNRDRIRRYNRDRYRANPETNRAGFLRREYGITTEQYDEMLAKQGGGCAVCGEQCVTGRRLAVDHSHDTGRVRGLLCSLCNRAAGLLRDSRVIVRNLADYLDAAEFEAVIHETPQFTGTTTRSDA